MNPKTPIRKKPKHLERRFNQDLIHQNTPPTQTAISPIQQKSNLSNKEDSNIDTGKIPRPSMDIIKNYGSQICQTDKILENGRPSAASLFVTQDKATGSPRFIRPTAEVWPIDQAVAQVSEIPFGAVVQPLAEIGINEAQIPVIDTQYKGPLRCGKCRAYVNPHFEFMQGIPKFTCNICRQIQEIEDPFAYTGLASGKLNEHPELTNGVYEFLAPESYNSDFGLHFPHYVVVIESSLLTNNQGVLSQVLSSIKLSLEYIPSGKNSKISFISFDHEINFFSISKSELKDPSITTVGDLESPFIPGPEEQFFFNLDEQREEIEKILEKIEQLNQNMSSSTPFKGSCFGSAILAAKSLLIKTGGKIMTFFSSLPSVGFGIIASRNFSSNYNTDLEKKMLSAEPEGPYMKLAKDLLKKRIGVDIFGFPTHDIDLATIMTLSIMTGGVIHFYPNYNSVEEAERLHYHIFHALSSNKAFDCAITCRISVGLSVLEYYGMFFKARCIDISIPSINSETTFGFTTRYDSSKLKLTKVHIQFALLYTDMFKVRRIRIINYPIPISESVYYLYKHIDCEATTNILSRIALGKTRISNVREGREFLVRSLIQILYYYRFHCAKDASPTQLVLPDALKSFPILIMCLLRHPAFQVISEIHLDKKMFGMYVLLSCSMPYFVRCLYPKVLRITGITNYSCSQGEIDSETGYITSPPTAPAMKSKLQSEEAYLIDNGEYISLFLGKDINGEFLSEIFGVYSFEDLEYQDTHTFPSHDTFISQKLLNLVEMLRSEVPFNYQSFRLILQDSPADKKIMPELMVEDTRNPEKEFSYPKFLSHIHNFISNKLKITNEIS